MTWFYISLPIMVIAVAVATMPILHLAIREERAHRGRGTRASRQLEQKLAYSTRPGPSRVHRVIEAPSTEDGVFEDRRVGVFEDRRVGGHVFGGRVVRDRRAGDRPDRRVRDRRVTNRAAEDRSVNA